ncbi:hypothetical protein [Sporolactobacillus pectinivorans]|nr:hypothetical protein [Sporolactobacillus pectinivorans]
MGKEQFASMAHGLNDYIAKLVVDFHCQVVAHARRNKKPVINRLIILA